MALDLDTILTPISEEQPSGEDLSYDNERAELEQAFAQGDTSTLDEGDAPERDWRGVLKLIENQFARTKDVWLAVYLARAGAESGSLATVETGVQALAGLFEQFWPTVHPQIEELGVPGRKSPCDSLCNRKSFLGPLERTILFEHPRLGRFSGADFSRFQSEGAGADGYGMFRAALDEVGVVGLEEAVGRLDSIEEALRRADKAFMNEAAGEDSPNYAPTYTLLSQLKTSVKSFIPGEEEEEEAQGGEGVGGGGGQRSVSGAVNSREDVTRVFDLIAAYYRQREPSHPMPMLIERAKQWVTLDYMTLMRDIAPDGVDQAKRVLNIRNGIFEAD